MISLFLAAALTLSSAPAAAPPVHVETLKSLDEVLALPAFKAKGVHVIHFWATWCEPCREEMPDMMKRAKLLARRGVDFSFISVDSEQDVKPKVAPFLHQVGGVFPGAKHFLLGANVDPDKLAQKIAPNWGGTVPVTFVYRDGKQLGFYSGATEQDALAHVPTN